MQQEIDSFLRDYPETEIVEVLVTDMSGIFRGKQMPVSALQKLTSTGVYFPITTCFLTTNGANAEAILDDYGSDPDRACVAIPGTLQPVPWAKRPTAQVLLRMLDVDDSPFFMDPHTVLEKSLAPFTKDGLIPVVALEYEFFLFEAGTVPPKPVAPPNGMPSVQGANCYNMDVFYDFEEILREIEDTCKAQGIPASALLCEYGNGQFEVNLEHRADAIRACDDAMLLKRAIKGVALKHGLHASFMAKPIFDEAGNGMHAHMSLLSEAGDNIFGTPEGEQVLAHAVGGLLATMGEATALFAPNANSYRRFDPTWFAPMVPNWGENNRRLSVRLPMSGAKDRRFEHRVCGADACPHLMLAAILAGVWYGMENEIDPGEKVGEFDMVSFDSTIPSRWKEALDAFKASRVLRASLGDDFCDLYHRIRANEEEDFHRAVTRVDHDQYLRLL